MGVLVTAVSVWCASLLTTPLLTGAAGSAGTAASGFSVHASLFYGKICHQDAARSFTMAGAPMPVCARCTGIYFGFLVGISLAALLFLPPGWPAGPGRPGRPDKLLGWARRLWLAAAVPMAVDVALNLAGTDGLAGLVPLPGVAEWPNIARLLTGIWFGVWTGLMIGAVISGPADRPAERREGLHAV